MISQYLEGDIKEIETAVPTLNILVPDMTWLDPQGFCAERWDTSDQRASVTYKRSGSNDKELFVNGYAMGEIESGTIPGGTVLVVKSSERIVADVPTKGAEPTYRFVDDAFDASKNEPLTKDIRYTGKYTFEWYAYQDEEDSSDYMDMYTLNSFNPDILRAYNILKSNSYACQNDFIFYGMSKTGDKGQLKMNVRAKMIRFKISPRSFNALFDDPYDGDKKFTDCLDTDDNGGRRPEPTVQQVYDALWAEGALEIYVDVYVGGSDGKANLSSSSRYSVKAKDLFTVKPQAISKHTWNSTMLKWYVTWQYKMEKRDEETLASKWYYPSNTPDLPTWDLITNSGYSIAIYEKDSGAKTTFERTVVTKRANTETVNGSLQGSKSGVTAKLDFGWTGSQEDTNSEKVTVEWNEGNDDMGMLHILYRDQYIKGISGNKYLVNSYTSGDYFTCTILPYSF